LKTKKQQMERQSRFASQTAPVALMTDDAEFVTIARVAKTQGRHGEVAATLLTDFPELFATRKNLSALGGTAGASGPARRTLDVEEHWFHKGMVVLKFAGVDSISDAERLVGSELQVPRSQRAELGSDQFYVSDLTGCTVTDSGREIGKIKDVQFGSGEAPLLVIEGGVSSGGVISGGVSSGNKEYLVPFATAYIEKIALEQKRVEMKLPPGLLELDAPLNQEEKQRQHKKS
jgi:16S rRNA processing protein RimM